MRCPQCGGTAFRPETDILDVWFDSGVSWKAVVERRPELGGRADLYLEGSDQHRGWFHSALLTGVAVERRAPYDIVITHGFFVDGSGRKMSKSLGNAIAPEEILKRHGAELLRLWVAATDYREEMRISEEILGGFVEAYRRVRNTARFLLGNLYDFDPAGDAVAVERLPELERWALHQTHALAELAPPPAAWQSPAVAARFEQLLTVRGAVTKALEEARQAGLVRQSSEARVALGAPSVDGLGRLLTERAPDLPALFLVADVTV